MSQKGSIMNKKNLELDNFHYKINPKHESALLKELKKNQLFDPSCQHYYKIDSERIDY